MPATGSMPDPLFRGRPSTPILPAMPGSLDKLLVNKTLKTGEFYFIGNQLIPFSVSIDLVKNSHFMSKFPSERNNQVNNIVFVPFLLYTCI
jgi:hypothetical protein